MEVIDMKYNLCSMEEPTEEQLQQIMKEACEDAVLRQKETMVKFEKALEQAVIEGKRNYKKKYGAA
ncbi:MAG: hypothetical protein KBT32_07330 [Bacteroidales bacterium]|nr:hypothetical protein [Candidatus Physcocola equi]